MIPYRLIALLALLALLPLAGCGGSGVGGTPAPAPVSTEKLRFEVSAPGIYRIAYEDLVAAGYNQGSYIPARFTLSTLGQAAALRVHSANPSAFAAGDYVECYAQGLDSAYTGTAVYWLGQDGAGPVAMDARSVAVTGTPAPLMVQKTTLHMEQDLVPWGLTPGAPAQDWWFWAKLTAPATLALPFQLAGLDEQAGGSTLTVCLQGGSTGGASPDHHAQVNLNGTKVGDFTWYGETVATRSFPVPAGLLVPGANTFSVTLPGDTGAAADLEYLNYFEITCWAPLQAQGDVAGFAVPAGQPVQVGGFSSPAVDLYDVTAPLAPVLLTGPALATGGGGTTATFMDAATGTRSYLALTEAQIRKPANLAPWTPGALRATTNGADYILITPRAFLTAVAPLVQLRTSQGLRATAVAVEDIFNEFANGIPDPQGIEDFLSYASTSWTAPAPANVLFFGDANYDYRDRKDTGKASRVPCHLTWTDALGLTPDDNWFVALDGKDLVPSMNAGRLPSASAAQAAALVQKIITYETAKTTPPQRVLFVADNNDASFNQDCATLAAQVPAGISAENIFLSDYSDYTQCGKDIVTALNGGVLLATYAGHGDVLVWAGEDVFDATRLASLTNADSLCVFVTLDCLNGWFAMPTEYCLAESVVNAPGCGGIAAYTTSGLGLEWETTAVATYFERLLFGGTRPTLGQACTQAKVAAYKAGASADVLTTFTLIGDPATRLRGLP